MNESQWDDKLRAFLKKTGDDLKRAGTDIKVEAEKLMTEMKDEGRQEKVKKGLETIKVWARKTAEEVAGVVETGMKKAEGTIRGTAEKVQGAVDVDAKPPATAPVEPAPEESAEPTAEEAPRHDTPVDTPAVKTIGTAKKKPAAKAKSGAKKPLGKKRTP